MKVVDLHCDLLSYLAESSKRTVFDSDSRASLPQLQKGNVFLQMMAIYTQTGKKSVASASKQFAALRNLLNEYSESFSRWNGKTVTKRYTGKTHLIPAIENASGLCDETEKLSNGLERLNQYLKDGPIFYISLTWHHANRFGGGNLTNIGLKSDGKKLLDYIDKKNIAIDLSHTSDKLAEGILNHIDKNKLSIIPIASHSNFRAVTDHPRNLPVEFVKEIVARGGIIGLNFVRAFVGQKQKSFLDQVEYARTLGILDHLCLGADFFYDKTAVILSNIYPLFFKKFGNSGCYPQFLKFLSQSCSEKELRRIAYENFEAYLKRRLHASRR